MRACQAVSIFGIGDQEGTELSAYLWTRSLASCELVRRHVLFLVHAGDSACFEILPVTRSSSSHPNKNDVIMRSWYIWPGAYRGISVLCMWPRAYQAISVLCMWPGAYQTISILCMWPGAYWAISILCAWPAVLSKLCGLADVLGF